MKKYIAILFTLFLSAGLYAASPTLFRDILATSSIKVGGSGVANSDAALELNSTTKGFLPARMTTTQQNAITSIPEGLHLYDTVKHQPAYYNGTAWLNIDSITGTATLTSKTIDGGSNTLTNINAATSFTGITPVANGGSGAATFTAHGVLIGEGTSAFNALAVGGVGTVLIGQTGANPVFSASPTLSNLTFNGSSSGVITMQPPATIPINYNFTLPAAPGNAGQIFTSGGGGSASNVWNFSPLKNYVGPYNNMNGDFETQATTHWTLGHVTVTSGLPSSTSPTFGTGASGNLSLAIVTSSQLAGAASLSYVSSAATTVGDLVASDAVTFDIEDLAKVLTFKFYYTQHSGTLGNYSGTSSNSFGVAIWDVANSVWIIPSGVYGMTQGSGTGFVTGTFQTPVNGTSFRLVVYNATATSGAATMYFDDFSLTPQHMPLGTVITDWISYTPTFTGFGTASGVNFKSRRVGDSLEVLGQFTEGTTTGTTAQITLGYNGGNANVTIDSSKVGIQQVIGSGSLAANATTYFGVYPITPGSASTNFINLSVQTSTANATSPAIGTAIGSANAVTIHFSVPITGFLSNVQVSNDYDTRVITAAATASSQTATATTAIPFTSVNWDNSGSVTAATGRFTLPVSGYYNIMVAGVSRAASTGNSLQIYKNGSFYANLVTFAAAASNYSAGSQVQGNTGDFFDLRTDGTIANFTLGFVTISKISGPGIVSAGESINMTYTDTAGSSIGTGLATYTFATKIFDSHNLYASGVYTINTQGKYLVTAQLETSTVTLSTVQAFVLAIQKNGTTFAKNAVLGNGATSQNYFLPVTALLSCLPGDTISLAAQSSVATTASTSSGNNSFSVIRMGN